MKVTAAHLRGVALARHLALGVARREPSSQAVRVLHLVVTPALVRVGGRREDEVLVPRQAHLHAVRLRDIGRLALRHAGRPRWAVLAVLRGVAAASVARAAGRAKPKQPRAVKLAGLRWVVIVHAANVHGWDWERRQPGLGRELVAGLGHGRCH